MTYPAGSLVLESVQDALYDWISEITSGVFTDDEEHILWRNQSEPLLARPCVTLKIIDGPRPIARNASSFYGKNVGIQMEMTLSIQVFGNSQIHQPMAMQLAMDINSSLMRPEILDGLKTAGISVQQVGQPRNLTALEETEYEERAGFDLLLGLAQNVGSNPGQITTINFEIETNVKDISGEIVLE